MWTLTGPSKAPRALSAEKDEAGHKTQVNL